MRVDLADDPSVVAVAMALGVSEDLIVGKLHRLWSWANRHLTDGHACVTLVSRSCPAKEWIDRYVGVTGFADALSQAGWLTLTEDGFQLPNFDVWNSQSAKQRLLASRRKRQERSRKCHATTVTNSRPQKRREESIETSKDVSSQDRPEGEKKQRARDHLFDAIAEATHSDPVTAGSHIGKVRSILLKAEPPYTPEEVREFARRFNELCGYASDRSHPELGELQKHIGKIRATRKGHADAQSPKANPLTENPPRATPMFPPKVANCE